MSAMSPTPVSHRILQKVISAEAVGSLSDRAPYKQGKPTFQVVLKRPLKRGLSQVGDGKPTIVDPFSMVRSRSPFVALRHK